MLIRTLAIRATRAALASVALLTGALSAANADVVTLAPAADNTLFLNTDEPSLLLSNGAGDGIFSGRTSIHASILLRAVLRFDLTVIPPGSTITGVQLTLNVDRTPRGAADTPVELRRLLASWGEGASSVFGGTGDPSQDGDANWYERFHPGEMWATPGGDFAPVASATATVPSTTGPVVWSGSPGLIDDVTSWINEPSGNFGWILLGDESQQGAARRYSSREAIQAGARPSLEVTFTMPPPMCAADFNADAALNSDDLSDFVTGYFNAPPDGRCDFNADGTINADDLGDFVTAYFNGC